MNNNTMEILENFDKKYTNIDTMIYNNIEKLTKEQKTQLLTDLKSIINDIEENESVYRSHFKTLQTTLKNIQFYEFLQSEGII